jgi:AcrR family transcriptional regulator
MSVNIFRYVLLFAYDAAMTRTTKPRPRGRPKAEDAPVALEDTLAAALRAFATHGYDGVSVSALSRELGVSHNLLHQRFGSKEGLWYAAVDAGFGHMIREVAGAFDPTITDPLEQLRIIIRRFLQLSAEQPEVLGLMNIEGRQDTERLTYLFDTYIGPGTAPIGRLLDHLAAEGRVRPISLRSLHFLMTHGGAAPFTLIPLAERFDRADPRDPDVVAMHADLVADIIVAGLRIDLPAHD